MKTANRILSFGFTGAGIGSLIATLCALHDCRSIGDSFYSVYESGIWFAVSFLIGIAALVFFTEKLKFLTATILHFCISSVLILPIALSLGYKFFETLLTFLGIYVVVYVLTFLLSCISAKRVNKHFE